MIVVTYGLLPAEEARNYAPTVVLLGDNNEIQAGRMIRQSAALGLAALALAACSSGAPKGVDKGRAGRPRSRGRSATRPPA